ncbi:tRNA cytosine(34) acetyltransferase TmcA [Vespertiliibacter pulmonis]|uniref:tRNA(Met) cytidine acetyltransferase TmcA n=1 Tax=Vespertiliibacter pulmonis TaxID=1443036 RepID=A0A3N4W8V0_9PAST|nr:GNAT family N-acetyltransferase [Vespertiliibacter pulmonis]QLB21548.1 tRNA cytosine(34) acetyltransferase TmcA [Vespertiliibacter pulmonis]RPE85967.1 tRNA(Met)-cytidine N(4)-acetyltransferase [Vespertiliibacter pulmonis]
MRKLVVIAPEKCSEENCLPQISALGQIIVPNIAKSIPFSNAKTLLGQEFSYVIYDMRAEQGICFNLDAFAIVAGTIQSNGSLYLICPNWDTLPEQTDLDALRWNGNIAITTPNFYHYFQKLVAEFNFPICNNLHLAKKRYTVSENRFNYYSEQKISTEQLTLEQKNILLKLPLAQADIHLITAPRGRGKSTLSGKLAQTLAKTAQVIITARSHSVLPNFWKEIESADIAFFAPDQLLQLISTHKISSHHWLFVDEAASLPLPILNQFCHYFDKVILTTTTHNYEGTGRGFSLKLQAQLQRSTQQWKLTQPLRYGENDSLENFIHRLLLLENSTPDFTTSGQFSPKICQKIKFFQLLSEAHYKTTPTDLRRLFDSPNQYFDAIWHNNQLIAGSWAMAEGGLDESLTNAIWRGERRPHGNLVAQYLCYQGNLPDACKLRSVRISRLAVQISHQQKGYGKRLISQIISQSPPLVDFLSVSFGMSQPLLQFWQACGFQLVQITPTREASSGYHSAMMLYPISPKGKRFTDQAIYQFERDLPLQPFYTTLGITPSLLTKKVEITPLIFTLAIEDWRNLHGFATAKRSLASSYVSLKRLAFAYPTHFSDLKMWFDNPNTPPSSNQKQWVTQLRINVQTFLTGNDNALNISNL